MTANQLARATEAFRRGYNDRLLGRPRNPQAPLGTFVCCDYVAGYLARKAEEARSEESMKQAEDDSRRYRKLHGGDGW